MPTDQTSAVHADRIAEAVRRAADDAHPSPPNQTAQALALRVMTAAEGVGVEFESVDPGPDGGLELGVSASRQAFCLINCLNSGLVHVMLSRNGLEPEGMAVNAFDGGDSAAVAATVGRLRAFLDSGGVADGPVNKAGNAGARRS